MKKIVALCGFVCSECPAYIATQNNNEEEKVKIALKWSTNNYEIKPEDINCLGCNSPDQNVSKYCKDCKIRICGMKKGHETCASCDEYPCNILTMRFEKSPDNKKTLDGIRKNL